MRCQFPESQTNALAQTTALSYDYSLGLTTGVTDPNGISTTFQYDAFGRKTRENRPDGTYSLWTYHLCTDGAGYCYYGDSTFYRVNKYDYGTDGNWFQWQVGFFDRFDHDTGIAHDNTFSVQIDRRRIYDTLGRLTAESKPFFITGGTQYFTNYSYDVLNRVTQTSRPVGDSDPSIQTENTDYEALTTRFFDPQGKQSIRVSTVLGQPARSADPDGYAQLFSYDPFGNLAEVQDSAGNTLQSNAWNIRGVRIGSTDVDMGSWTYTPNSLGEIVSRTDANAKTTVSTFDALSRPLTRTGSDGSATVTYTYSWGTSPTAHNIGQLEWQQIAGTSILDNRQTFSYDSVGRLTRATYSDLEAALDYRVDQTFSAVTGLLDTLAYPISTSNYQLTLQYDYQNGRVYRISDFNAPATVFWRGYATDPYDRVSDEELGNGLRTKRGFDAVTGWADYIQTGPGGGASIQNLSYLFDRVGNLIQRQDTRQTLTENFYYDNLYRLDYSELNGTTNLDLTYNSLGNITNKSGVGAYGYHASKIHAVTTVGGGASSIYDGNGNNTGVPGDFTFSHYTSGLPKTANWVVGGYSSTFQLGPDEQRFKQTAAYPGGSDTITYIGGLVDKELSASTTTWKHYIFAPTGRVALYTRKSSGTPGTATYYFTRDHMGSIDSITDAAGAVQVRLSYDAFGARRKEAGWSGAVPNADWTKIYAITHRGFTDHEMLDDLDVIHMNGRLFDPDSGRFVSADPFLQNLDSTQTFNRYSYVLNNPLSFTDPSGYAVHYHAQNVGLGEVEVRAAAWSSGGVSMTIGSGSRGGAATGGHGSGGSSTREKSKDAAEEQPQGENPDQKPPEPPCTNGPTYMERYVDWTSDHVIDVGPYAAALAGGVWPKSWAPATGGRPPLLGSGNPLTSVPRAFGFPGAGSAVARTGAAGIGLLTVGIGFYDLTIELEGFLYAIPDYGAGSCKKPN